MFTALSCLQRTFAISITSQPYFSSKEFSLGVLKHFFETVLALPPLQQPPSPRPCRSSSNHARIRRSCCCRVLERAWCPNTFFVSVNIYSFQPAHAIPNAFAAL